MSNSESAKLMYEEGKSYTNERDYAQARVKFTQAINLDAQEPYYFARGYVYMLIDDYSQAWSDFEKALMLDANSVGALSGLGFISKQRGNYPAAISFYSRAAEIAPKAAQIYIRRAQVYMAAGLNDKYEEDKRLVSMLLLFEQDTSETYYII